MTGSKRSMNKIRNGVCVFCLLLCGLLFSSCVHSAAQREYKLYCGMSSKNGEVSEEAWRNFCDRYVSTSFPDGYTVFDAAGYWSSAASITVKEKTKVILIIAPNDAKAKVILLAKQYQRLFSQETVLISDTEAKNDLIKAE